MSLLDSVLAFKSTQEHLLERQRIIRGTLGLPNGTVTTSRAGYHWVRLFGLNSMAVQAYNNKTSATAGLQVYVSVDPNRTGGVALYTVLGTVGAVGTFMAPALDEKSKYEELAGAHGRSHEYGESNVGRDPLNVYARAIVPLRVQPTSPPSMRLIVNPGVCGNGTEYLGGITDVITAPASGQRIDCVYLDASTGLVAVATGTAATTITDPLLPPGVAAGSIPLAHVLLDASTTTIEEQQIHDVRPFFTYSTGPSALIASAVLTAGATSVTFSNIPGIYTDLLLTGVARTDRAAEDDNIAVRFNSDSGNNYGWIAPAFKGTSGGTFSATCYVSRSDSKILASRAEGGNASTGNFAPVWFMIPSYATSTRKAVTSGGEVMFGNEDADADYIASLYGGHWRSTAAITGITLFPQVGPNFVAGSRFYLWGLK